MTLCARPLVGIADLLRDLGVALALSAELQGAGAAVGGDAATSAGFFGAAARQQSAAAA
jgi:hypothetical protein